MALKMLQIQKGQHSNTGFKYDVSTFNYNLNYQLISFCSVRVNNSH